MRSRTGHPVGDGAFALVIAIAVAVAAAACGTPPASPVAASCPTDRRVVLASQADITRIERCATLSGVLIRSGASLDTSVLRALTKITGDLVIGPTVGIHEVTLAELRVVEGAVHASSNGLLQGLFLSKLERAGQIDIDGNVALTTISLPRLAAVHGALHITDNASLEAIDIPVLEAIDRDLVLSGDPQLTLLDASQLQRAGSVRLEVPKLPPDLIERLRTIAVQ